MDYPTQENRPVILQLHRWNSSVGKINISDFSHAYISPTRQILVLISDKEEAMLCYLNEDEFSHPGYPDSMKHSVHDWKSFNGCKIKELNSHPFIYGVKSLAWGVCEDDYSQNKSELFREFLFIASDYGVVVHAFCHANRKSVGVNYEHESFPLPGMWVEWGPKLSSYNVNREEHSTLWGEDSKISDNCVHLKANGIDEQNYPHKVLTASRYTPKRWLKTYFTSVNTGDWEDAICTHFPQRSSFPCNAEVVSFNIFNAQLSSIERLSSSISSEEEIYPVYSPILDPISHALSKFVSNKESISYKCSRVFSSSSSQLVGFVLCLVQPECSNEHMRNKILLVARLLSDKMCWLCSVNLEYSQKIGQFADWIDFKFANNHVVCLNASGMLSLYDVSNGVRVALLNILRTFDLKFVSVSHNQNFSTDIHCESVAGNINDGGDIFANSDNPNCDFGGKIIFRRLLLASKDSLLAAVDQFGTVYVLHDWACEFDELILSEEFPPFFDGWEAASSVISQRRMFSQCFDDHNSNPLFLAGGGFSSVGGKTSNRSKNPQRRMISWNFMPDFNRVRRLFLSTAGFRDDDFIFFSAFGIARLIKRHNIKENTVDAKLVNSRLCVGSTAQDDMCLHFQCVVDVLLEFEENLTGGVLGCASKGYFYLITDDGISVFLPSILSSSQTLPIEVGYQKYVADFCCRDHVPRMSEEPSHICLCSKVEVIDQILVTEGQEEADNLCLENGWDLKISGMCRLQSALYFLKFDDLERSLEMLVKLNMVGEGILKLLFRAVDIGFNNTINHSDVSAALRLLAIGTKFTIMMIHNFGFVEYMEHAMDSDICSQATIFGRPAQNAQMLSEMAQFLEIIRKLQHRLSKEQIHDAALGVSLVQMNTTQSDSRLLDLMVDTPPFEPPEHVHSVPLAWMDAGAERSNSLYTEIPMIENQEKGGNGDMTLVVCQEEMSGRQVLLNENPKDPIPFQAPDNLDLRAVVKNALLNSRLPFAVLQVHLHHFKGSGEGSEVHDTFTKVIDIGRSVAYELFIKGKTALALETLRKLGDDIETSLRHLVFGSLRSGLRLQIVKETKEYEYFDYQELQILDKISIIERLYPGSSFWSVYYIKQGISSSIDSDPDTLSLHLLNGVSIQCGEVDGVVLGLWMTSDENFDFPYIVSDSTHTDYWVAAAIWSCVWDMRTFDRVILDRSFQTHPVVMWESELEYNICHSDIDKVSELLKAVPPHMLLDGCLHVSLNAKLSMDSGGHELLPDYSSGIITFPRKSDIISVDSSDIKLLSFTTCNLSSTLLSSLMEQELAKQFIFARDYWDGTEGLLPVLVRSCLMVHTDSQYVGHTASENLIRNFHKILTHHCTLFELPNLLDLFFDHHNLLLDHDLVDGMLEVTGNSEQTKWLIFSRVNGREFDASFSNARSILSLSVNSVSSPETDALIHTVEDIAEGGGEMAALASLMFSPISISNCLRSGSISRECNSMSQCTLESLQPIFYNFPTLRHIFVAVCFGGDSSSNSLSPIMSNDSDFSVYLDWRDTVFYSYEKDTSLVQILPIWFSRNVQRLLRLYVQPPLDLQTGDNCSYREADLYFDANEDIEIDPTSWEAAIQGHIEEELHTSSVEDTGMSLEQKVQRGRPFGAFTHILGLRIQRMKAENAIRSSHDSPLHWRKYSQSDSQALLSHITESEEYLLSSVKSLAITHFEDSVLVASCVMLFEICGLPAAPLRIDIASLTRISCFLESSQSSKYPKQFERGSSSPHSMSQDSDIMLGLARALAENISKSHENGQTSVHPPSTLVLVLQHLEKASLPPSDTGESCGSWLLNSIGDGTKMRFKQKMESQKWCLVRDFCQLHGIPLSLKYLALLAQDNDWVGFLSEAQIGGYALEDVIQTASKEFSNQPLKAHVLTVLRSIRKNYCSYYTESMVNDEFSGESNNMDTHAELFEILAKCEMLKNPGQDLLAKAKTLSWSILTLLASCFPDVSPLSCLTSWLEITASRELYSTKVNDFALKISSNVEAAVEASNSLSTENRAVVFHYNRRNPKRRKLTELLSPSLQNTNTSHLSSTNSYVDSFIDEHFVSDVAIKLNTVGSNVHGGVNDEHDQLGKIIVLLCQRRLFLPLLKAFEMFFPSCPLLPFIRSLQAFLQMRFPDASAHLGSFSSRIKDELANFNVENRQYIDISWIISTAKKAADAVFSELPSAYEKQHLLQLLAETDFGDGGSFVAEYKRLLMKFDLIEPSLSRDDPINFESGSFDDVSLLTELMENREWEHARNWAKQLDILYEPSKSYVNVVTEKQAESMVTEWKEFLWDVREERVALWNHCQSLFLKFSYPPQQAGIFFLRHVEAVEKDLPPSELHSLLLLSLQWLSGMITMSSLTCPLHLLREIETRVWLLAVESEAQVKNAGDVPLASSIQITVSGNDGNIIDRTASVIAKMDAHMDSISKKDKGWPIQGSISSIGSGTASYGIPKIKRRARGNIHPPKLAVVADRSSSSGFQNVMIEMSTWWVDRVMPGDLERAVLSLLEFGQISAAKQLQHKISPDGGNPSEISLLDASLELAALSTPNGKLHVSFLGRGAYSVLQLNDMIPVSSHLDPLQTLDNLIKLLPEGRGKGLGQRIVAVVKAANVLGLPFEEVIKKAPIEMLQLLLLKAQYSFEEATLLVHSHSIPPSSIAQILAESFLKGLLAAHRGGYLESQKEEGPAPLLWKFSDFLRWAELCPLELEIGHALMRLVITGQEIPHACEVELMILSYHFYKSSCCLDGVDVIVALAANRVEAYLCEGDFDCLARLVSAIANFRTLNFVLGILIENGKLGLVLEKYAGISEPFLRTREAVRGFRMVVLTSLKHYAPDDLDALAMVYRQFDMKHETASLMEWRGEEAYGRGLSREEMDKNGQLLESMWQYIEAASVLSTVDAGNKTRKACAHASLVSLQIRIPDIHWLDLSETNARRALADQSSFQVALVVAEAYALNCPTEWGVVLWNHMLNPDIFNNLLHHFLLALPLHPSTLLDIARFYRAELSARPHLSHFPLWLPRSESANYLLLHTSFASLLSVTSDLKLRLQLANIATGFPDVVRRCTKALDRVPNDAGPLVVRKGHGATYLPFM